LKLDRGSRFRRCRVGHSGLRPTQIDRAEEEGGGIAHARTTVAMRKLIGRLRDPVIAFDDELNIAGVNLATERLFDYSACELIGHNTMKLRPIDHGLREERNRQIREQGFIEGVVECLNTAGEVFAIDLRTRRIGLMKTDGIEYLAVMRPVTDATVTNDFAGMMRVQRLYTPDEAAALLRKSTRTIRRMLHDGSLGGQKIGRTWRIPESELQRLTHLDRDVGATASTTDRVGGPWTPDR
jgi:excisionase family DNA binding protein/PAS domain S-box-containing protein